MAIAQREIENLKGLYPELIENFGLDTAVNRGKIAKRAVMNFEYQREKRYAGGKSAPVLRD